LQLLYTCCRLEWASLSDIVNVQVVRRLPERECAE
jgi:hypothetical protein